MAVLKLVHRFLAVLISFVGVVLVVIATGVPSWVSLTASRSINSHRLTQTTHLTLVVGLFETARSVVENDDDGGLIHSWAINDSFDSANNCHNNDHYCTALLYATRVFVILSCVFGAASTVLLSLQTFQLINLGTAKRQRFLLVGMSILTTVLHVITIILWTVFQTKEGGAPFFGDSPFGYFRDFSATYSSSFALAVAAAFLFFANCFVVALIHPIKDAISDSHNSAPSRCTACRSSTTWLFVSFAMLAVGSIMLIVATAIDSWSLVIVNTGAGSASGAIGPFALRGSDGSRQSASDFCDSDSKCYSEMSTVQAFLILAILSSAFTFLSLLVWWVLVNRPFGCSPTSRFPSHGVHPKRHAVFALVSSAFGLIGVIVWNDVSQYLWNTSHSYLDNSFTFGAGFIVAVVGMSLVFLAALFLLCWIPVESVLPGPIGLGNPLMSSSSSYPEFADTTGSVFCGFCGHPICQGHHFCTKCGRSMA